MRSRDDAGALYVLDQERRFIITFPTNDDLDMVFLFWPAQESAKVRADVDGNFYETLDLVPELAERVRTGNRETSYTGAHHIPNYFRRAGGPGWALVGDAALHRCPITAQGMTNAFIHAELLAEELSLAFTSDKTVDRAVAEYDARQYELLRPMFDYTVFLSQLQPFPDEMRAMIAALPGNQPAINAFLGAFLGSVPLDAVFPPHALEDFSTLVDAHHAAGQETRHVP
jgi:2-polyprenyl-6-methoxyphenol hydroxylase-like FAD-dependent oxidoreductase